MFSLLIKQFSFIKTLFGLDHEPLVNAESFSIYSYKKCGAVIYNLIFHKEESNY